MPMVLAKAKSEQNSTQFQRSCYSGTFLGLTLAISGVGKYLISDNLANFFLYFVLSIRTKTGQLKMSDTIVVILIVITNLVIWKDV